MVRRGRLFLENPRLASQCGRRYQQTAAMLGAGLECRRWPISRAGAVWGKTA